MSKPLGNAGLLKLYFKEPYRSLTMDEMKALSKEERSELATLAAKELGYVRNPDGNWVPK